MSNRIVIKAENISKLYRLGEVGTGTISHDINRAWNKIIGKEDPYLKIAETNDREAKSQIGYVWSLKEINFEINKGDTVGIIGRNGAGKSTLLKLLSKVTKPTTGRFKLNGRVASLLEVGTGFNPEMTGRENIFLNGAILGMSKNEIKRKFDEIVEFAGVERYVDTPVKRYSSGMYVRLAFAVAANLESEILIVDEVLAVGDSEFQKKCLGKMNDISKGEGRTVLFVSHNIAAINQLCNKGLLLHKGSLIANGDIKKVINKYQDNFEFINKHHFKNDRPSEIDILKASINNSNNDGDFFVEEPMYFKIQYIISKELKGSIINFIVSNNQQNLFMSFDTDIRNELLDSRRPGTYESIIIIPSFSLKPGMYNISIGIGIASGIAFCQYNEAISFEISSKSNIYSFNSYREDRYGIVPKVIEWETKQIN